jgi:hypothetical protein
MHLLYTAPRWYILISISYCFILQLYALIGLITTYVQTYTHAT